MTPPPVADGASARNNLRRLAKQPDGLSPSATGGGVTPLLSVVFSFTVGILVGIFLHPPFWISFWVGIVSAFIGLPFPSGKAATSFFGISCFCLGILRWEGALWERNLLENAFGKEKEAWIEGVVVTDPVPSSFGRQTFLLRRKASRDPWALAPLVKVIAPADRLLDYGETILLKGFFSPFPSARNPGGPDWRAYFQGRSLYGTFRVRETDPMLRIKSVGLLSLNRWLLLWKRSLVRSIKGVLPSQEASFLSALLVGDRAEFPPELWELLSRIGVVHLLSISGFHVGIVVLCLLFFLRRIGLSKRKTSLATLLFLGLFVALVGPAPPILRAGLMAALYLTGKILWRQAPPFHPLAASFAVLIFLNPFYLFEAGFQLSFLSVFVILATLSFVQTSLRPFRNPVRFVLESFWVSAAVWGGIFPVVAWHFHLLNPIAFLANLCAIPYSFLLVAIGLVWLLIGSWNPFSSSALLTMLSWTASSALALFRAIARIPFGSFHVGRPSPLFCLFYYGFFLAWLWASQLRLTRRRILLGALVFLNVWAWGTFLCPRDEVLRATFFDVGHGDAALLEFPKGGTLLIDGGRRDDRVDVGREVIAPALWMRGYDRLDAVLLSHADADHVGGLPTLLKEFHPRYFFESGLAGPTGLYRDCRAALTQAGLDATVLQRGNRLVGIPEVTLDILHPPNPYLTGTGRDENNNGLVLKVTYWETALLFAADLEENGVADLLTSRQNLSATLIKFPHHGGHLDNGREFLQAVSPEVTVISVGRLYSLPSRHTFNQLASLKIPFFQTVEEGALVVESDGTSLKVKRFRNGGESVSMW